MRDQRRPVLRMLGAVLAADRAAQHDRKLELAGRHRLPLGHLIEDFVARAADEVGVHELDQGAAALERVADRGRHDRGLGNRRIENPVIGKQLRKAAIDAERASPLAALFTVGDQALVVEHVMEDGLEQAVPERDRPHCREPGAGLGEAETALLRVLDDPRAGGGIGESGRRLRRNRNLRVGEHQAADQYRVRVHVDDRRYRGIHCGRGDLAYRLGDFGPHRLNGRACENPRFDQGRPERKDGIVGRPAFNLVFRAIGVGVGRRMSVRCGNIRHRAAPGLDRRAARPAFARQRRRPRAGSRHRPSLRA